MFGSRGSRVQLACRRVRRCGRASARTGAIGVRFGIPLHATPVTILDPTSIPLAPGRIVLLVGPSGSGKSSALEQIARRVPGGCSVQRVSFPPETAIVDRIAPWATLPEAIATLTGCGLGEAGLWVRCFDSLSDGEKFRARLARAVALHLRGDVKAPLLCDEYCAQLHRRAAKAISYNLRRLVARTNMAVVVACAQEDLIDDLRPDVLVRFRGRGRCEVEERPNPRRRPISFLRKLRIEEGCKRDYQAFAAMHYRATDELGFVDRVFVLRDGTDGELLGIVVYSHGPLELSLRNQATDGWFKRRPDRVNRSLRILRRLVMHPDVRGCGLGHRLVRKTMPMLGTQFVECLAGMGEFNPVFEKAGMRRIGQYEQSPAQQKAIESLHRMGVDPNGREFLLDVSRRVRVREVVARVVYDWYAATTAGGEVRVERQSPEFLAQTFRGLIGSRPVYYLWRRCGGKAA